MNNTTELNDKELAEVFGGSGDDYGFTSCSLT